MGDEELDQIQAYAENPDGAPLADEDAALLRLSSVPALALRLDTWLLMAEDFAAVAGTILPAVHTIAQVPTI